MRTVLDIIWITRYEWSIIILAIVLLYVWYRQKQHLEYIGKLVDIVDSITSKKKNKGGEK